MRLDIIIIFLSTNASYFYMYIYVSIKVHVHACIHGEWNAYTLNLSIIRVWLCAAIYIGHVSLVLKGGSRYHAVPISMYFLPLVWMFFVCSTDMYTYVYMYTVHMLLCFVLCGACVYATKIAAFTLDT